MMNINQYPQNNHLLIHIVLLFTVLLLTGCSSIQVGRDFDVKAFENMAKVDKTTKIQVRAVLGLPKSSGVSINRNGERLVEWVYFYVTGKMSAMDDAALKVLQVRFQENGKLHSYNWSNSEKK